MSDDSPPPKKADAGAPAWVMTFADLMSLLMCFFVLLLAFSEMDALKFKQIAGSMQFAFGVQRDIKAKEIPKGTSIIAKEFSPGKPDPTVIAEVKQSTQESMQRFLEVEQDGSEQLQKNQKAAGDGESDDTLEGSPSELQLKEFIAQLEADATEIEEQFREEIEQGLIEIETKEQRIIIRVQEEGSFPSGSASMKGGFKPVMKKLADLVSDIKGKIIVAGHTDNIPISTRRFRSNWELSAARAVSFLHHLGKANEAVGEERFLIEGHGDTDPLFENDTAERRAKNRRVEVIIVQSPEELTLNKEVLGVDDAIGPVDDGLQEAPTSPDGAPEATEVEVELGADGELVTG